MLNTVREAGPQTQAAIAMVRESMPYYGITKTVTRKTPMGSFQLPIKSEGKLTKNQMRFLMQMLPEARSIGLAGGPLNRAIVDAVRGRGVYADWAKKLGIEGASDVELNGMVEVANRIQHFFEKLGAWEGKRGYLKFFDKEYFPKEWAALEKAGLDAHWQKEKAGVDRLRSLKAERERIKIEEQKAERLGDLARVAELRYGQLLQVERSLEQENARLAA
jgi:hypothetical protein